MSVGIIGVGKNHSDASKGLYQAFPYLFSKNEWSDGYMLSI